MEPLTSGKYPQSMCSLVGKRLPKFSKKQARLLKGSFDFIGLNYYTSMYATNAPQPRNGRLSYDTDSHVNFTSKHIFIYWSLSKLMNIFEFDDKIISFVFVIEGERNGIPIGQRVRIP